MLFPNDQRRRRIFRGIAILFLLYTGVDLFNPQLCSEEAGLASPQRIARRASVDTSIAYLGAVERGTKESNDNQTPDKPVSQDEDCFCCCAHVVPGTVFDGGSISEIRLNAVATQLIVIPLLLQDTHYHPPRIA